MPNIIAKLKKVGQKNYENIRIEIPEKLNEKLKNHEIEILDLQHHTFSEAHIFISKNKEDIYSIKLNPNLIDSFKNAFNQIYEYLILEEQRIKENNLITESSFDLSELTKKEN
ncbi:MAG: hypothetical protein NT094_03935 [Candidatus Staskawiczbacteria bacterium]|nr:hypothetical protein [Candidatus Staskawiczbacteria bacterium]